MATDEDHFRIRSGRVRGRAGGRATRAVRPRPKTFLAEVHQAIRRAGGDPNRLGSAGKGSGRFNARGRGATAAAGLKDRSAWSRDASGVRTRARRVTVKARIVKLNPQRGAARRAGGGYRRDHLRAFAQRVEVAEGEGRIMGSKSRLLQVLTGKNGVNSVPTQGLKWRRGCPHTIYILQ